jgi:glyoxylase-like metal-dependent hydrolase (beta-lactamase superfamily II)
VKRFPIVQPAIAAACTLIFAGLNPVAYAAHSKLHLERVVADEASIYAVAVEVVGPTEILLWDAQFHVADAKRLADQIASSGKHLKAIVISHPDGDHYDGAGAILERFPGTPVYMTATALEIYNKTAESSFQKAKTRTPDLFPSSLVTPQVLPSMHLTVDGEDVEVVPDLQGDMHTNSNSFLWIPSLRAILAGDIVFSGVHPYLSSSTESSRAAWRESIKRMSDLHPRVVVAGHIKDTAAKDSPDLLKFMDSYLSDFDALRMQSPDAQALFMAMSKKYPDLAIPRFLQASANSAYATK